MAAASSTFVSAYYRRIVLHNSPPAHRRLTPSMPYYVPLHMHWRMAQIGKLSAGEGGAKTGKTPHRYLVSETRQKSAARFSGLFWPLWCRSAHAAKDIAHRYSAFRIEPSRLSFQIFPSLSAGKPRHPRRSSVHVTSRSAQPVISQRMWAPKAGMGNQSVSNCYSMCVTAQSGSTHLAAYHVRLGGLLTCSRSYERIYYTQAHAVALFRCPEKGLIVLTVLGRALSLLNNKPRPGSPKLSGRNADCARTTTHAYTPELGTTAALIAHSSLKLLEHHTVC